MQKALLKNDSSAVVPRNFDLQKIEGYSTQKEFQYEEQQLIDTSWWDRFWRWIWDLINTAFENRYSGNFIKYLVIAIVVALVIFAVIKILGLDLKIFAGKSKAVDVPYDESLENIHEINFNEEIDKAVGNGNYRLAVRLLYLRSLKLLSDRELIHWQPEKTNQAYVDELADQDGKEQFKVLTLQFEYIWYGDFAIDKDGFKGIKGNFERFNVKTL
ncbi:DUF4129 domain-containing protein [Pedobacter nyackensis]|uniref:DUF4129 domain-containing protein n=1 Tax=Pedobacter nyackensis TaxID=475255 RepID=UPI002930BAED|nr:DUF4129 domain-containing protein [Pedobacter nyackensis]